MLEQGWITQAQLRRALEAQKAAGSGRLGYGWCSQHAVSEQRVTRALGLQWSCPVLPLEIHDSAYLAGAMPRLFVDAYGALPLRVAAGRVLYLGFEESLDPVLALAVERMTGLRVESGVVQSSLFLAAHSLMLRQSFPRWNWSRQHPKRQPVMRWQGRWSAPGRLPPGWSGCTIASGCGCGQARRQAPLPETGSIPDVVCSIGRI